ncbi:hypothetical protein [Glycomyces arizonensis]|uniref:hypothetical protein n=1 Tax=Glycomyces arizonensis TaxID=256035 RepID=UPI000408D04F|nr:hypothetical protein [Glycomyces arizonensis]
MSTTPPPPEHSQPPENPQYPQSYPQPGYPQPGFVPQAPPAAKKPWYLRWWSITIAVVFVLCCSGGIIGALGDDTDTGDEASEASSDADDQSAAETGEPAGADEADEAGGEEAEGEAEEAEEEEEADYFSSSFPVFDAVTESGSGDSVIDLPAGQGIITASHSGSGNFILTTLDENNEMSDLPVNAIGSYDGTAAYGIAGLGGDATSLEITAGGSWEITIAPIADAPELGDPQESQGDGVYRYTGGAANWKLTHDGAHNFIVTYVSDSMFGFDLLVNEIGSYDGTSAVTSGPAVVIVNADGGWSIASE